MRQDTIAAISTPLGESGIGIVRLSGNNTRPIAQKLFNKRLSNRRLAYGHIIDPESNEVVDEVLVAYMKAPHTYTREDIIEDHSFLWEKIYISNIVKIFKLVVQMMFIAFYVGVYFVIFS